MFKYKIINVLLICLLILNCTTSKESVQKEVKPLNPLDIIVGVWEGSYTGANQGETGLTLDVYKERDKYVAVFHYYNLPGKNNVSEGKYYMDVSFNDEKGIYFLKASEWIVHPKNYSWGDLEGNITDDIFAGIMIVSNSKSVIRFSVVRQEF